MATKKNDHLGSGLAEIFGDNVTDVLDEIQSSSKSDEYGRKAVLSVYDIQPNPYQPRKEFDQDKLNELAQSIKENGIFTPVLVRKAVGGYQLIAGERRLRASKIAGLEEIPAIIMDFTDEQMAEISLLENIQREDLNVLEEANAYNKLMKTYGYTQEQLAKRIGKSREHVANTLRLLKLPADVQKLVEEKKLSMGHVRALITLDKDRASAIANKAVAEGLSVRQVEALAADKKPEVKVEKKVDPFVKDLQNRLQSKYGTKVKVTDNSINISYSSNEDLNRILEIMGLID